MTKHHPAGFKIKLTRPSEIKRRMLESFHEDENLKRDGLKKSLIRLGGDEIILLRRGVSFIHENRSEISANILRWLKTKFTDAVRESDIEPGSPDFIDLIFGDIFFDPNNLDQLLLLKSGLKSVAGGDKSIYEDNFYATTYKGVDPLCKGLIDVSLEFNGVKPGVIDDYISKAGGPHSRRG